MDTCKKSGETGAFSTGRIRTRIFRITKDCEEMKKDYLWKKFLNDRIIHPIIHKNPIHRDSNSPPKFLVVALTLLKVAHHLELHHANYDHFP